MNLNAPETTPTRNLGFEVALRALKNGKRVAREGWNGKDMWAIIIYAGNAMHTSRAGGFPMQDCIGLKDAQGNMQPRWKPSNADMLAEDWTILPD